MPIPAILQKSKDLGHTVFETGVWNLNLIGVRSQDNISNTYNDSLHVVCKDEIGNWIDICFQITTDPGLYHLQNPSRIEGTAILVPGQYRGVWKIDKHRGRYDALCQRNGKVKVYRDSNRDNVLDMDASSVSEGWFGINIHRSNSRRESTVVEKWSAGCQVFAHPKEFDVFMSFCRLSASLYGNSFSYTLIEE
ncbi:TPA: hypothetical protein EYN09_05645 [Candidatus Poribacteria bacterium]|nr:hypothetical protein [Flavobacteriales bacterium]HIO06396.1 hypothetical protein [Candidatus Poribacteria bacterium]